MSKISELSSIGAVTDDDYLVIVDAPGSAPSTRRVTAANAKTYFQAGGGTLADGDKGDITVSGSGATWTIDNDVVTNAKTADMAVNTIKGRITAGTGNPEDLTSTQVKTIIGVATDATTGVVELATTAEVATGTDAVRAITPAGLVSRVATETQTGLVELATQAEVNTGTDAVRAVTPVTLANYTGIAGQSTTQFSLTQLAASGSIVIPWGSGRNFQINTAGFNITGATETGAPASGNIFSGTIEIINNGAGTSTVDLTGLSNGLDATVSIPPGGRDLLVIWSTGS